MEKPNKLLILFIFFFFFSRHNSKSIWCTQIWNISNNYFAYLLHSYFFWASCVLLVVSSGLKTVPKTLRVLMRTLFSFSCNNCVGQACIVWPHLDYWMHAVQAATSLLGTNCSYTLLVGQLNENVGTRWTKAPKFLALFHTQLINFFLGPKNFFTN